METNSYEDSGGEHEEYSELSCSELRTFFVHYFSKSLRATDAILQVRSAYVKSDFEWDNLKKLSFKVGLIFSLIYC